MLNSAYECYVFVLLNTLDLWVWAVSPASHRCYIYSRKTHQGPRVRQEQTGVLKTGRKLIGCFPVSYERHAFQAIFWGFFSACVINSIESPNMHLSSNKMIQCWIFLLILYYNNNYYLLSLLLLLLLVVFVMPAHAQA